MKDELGGKIIAEFAALRPKTYSYLTDEKSKRHKKVKFENYKHCLEATQLENKIRKLEKMQLM